jgi:hypothetical protein
VGDVDGDGSADIVFGEQDRDTVSVALGPLTGDRAVAEMDIVLEGSDDAAAFGWAVSGAGDLDRDGRDDVLVGAPATRGRRGAGYVYLGR